MQHMLDQILPSLEALGLWSYWIIGAATMLEAFFVTGVFVPGTLIVDAGGILVQQGILDFFDLAWFVAIGSILGGELGYWAGIWARRGMHSRWSPEHSPSYQRAERLFRRHGGLALVLGRFTGPVSGFVPFSAAIAGMDRRRFLIWNIASGFPYALAHVALGYFLGGALARIGPLASRLTLLAAGVLVLLAVLWWLVVRIERMFPFVLSIMRSIAQAIIVHPDVAAWADRNPRTARLIARRLDPSRASGLTATLIGVAVVYVLFIWAGSVLDYLMAEPILQADQRLANLIHAFWTPQLLKAAAHVTALGDWRVVTSLLIASVAMLWLRRRPDLMLGLLVSVIGNVLTVALLKRIFDRPRPELAYFVETTGSFPSGHAAISVAFWAMLFFVLWRLRLLGPIVAGLGAATLAFVIGFSRVYLIEHYLTDVLNGWLVGTIWMLTGIAVAEWWRETRITPPTPAPVGMRAAGIALALGLGAFASWQVVTYQKARNVPIPRLADQTVTDIPALFASGRVPNTSESVIGAPLEPINVLARARDTTALQTAMSQAGWTLAENPTLGNLARAGWTMLTATADDSAPVTPYFWRGAPDDVAFQKPADGTARKRHHVRFWRTEFVSPDGLRLFVGAASFDDGLDWQLLHHIDPNLDAERDRLAADLQAAGVVAHSETTALSPARLGESVAGDPWFTDGNAVVLTLR